MTIALELSAKEQIMANRDVYTRLVFTGMTPFQNIILPTIFKIISETAPSLDPETSSGYQPFMECAK